MTRPFNMIGFQLDIARQMEKPETLERIIRGMGAKGYNLCALYLEDAFEYPRHPKIARKNALSVEAARDLGALCQVEGMELMPVIPALGHCAYITGKPTYERFDEGRDSGRLTGTVSPSTPETYDLLRELFEDWCQNVPGQYLHVGLDESPAMGQLRSRLNPEEEFDPAEMFAAHCEKLREIVHALGRKMVIWGDMFYYYPKAAELISKDIIIADWYYYPFDSTPRVEAFNFAPVDSAARLKELGFEVWGCPSLWPNSPFPNIMERYENLASWVKYAQTAKLDGALLTDWENSNGFPETTATLSRVFGEYLAKGLPARPETAIRSGIAEALGVSAADPVVDVAMNLGAYHFTGHENRVLLREGLLALANCNGDRRREFERKYHALQNMFKPIEAAAAKLGDEAPPFFKTLQVLHETIWMFWKLGAFMPRCYDTLYLPDLDIPAERQLFKDLAREVTGLLSRYDALWNTVRYADETSAFRRWASRVIDELKSWAERLDSSTLENHPLLKTPRLEAILRCDHPAIPSLDITARWENGAEQSMTATMIRFEGDYAVPDKSWRQYPVLPLKELTPPDTIECVSRRYGEVVVETLRVVCEGKFYEYALVEADGDSVFPEGETIAIGPKRMRQGDPTIRASVDKAVFALNE